MFQRRDIYSVNNNNNRQIRRIRQRQRRQVPVPANDSETPAPSDPSTGSSPPPLVDISLGVDTPGSMSSETSSAQSTPPPSTSVAEPTTSDPLPTTSTSSSYSPTFSSESSSSSTSEYRPPPPPPSSTPPTSTPSYERTAPAMSSTTPIPTVPTTDDPPPPSSSAPPPPPPTTMTTVSTSVVVPPPPPPTTTPSMSDTGMRETTSTTSYPPFTSSTASSSSTSSTPSTSQSLTSNLPGGPDDVTTTGSSSGTPPPSGSSTSTPSDGSSSSSSTTGGPSSPDRPDGTESSTSSLEPTRTGGPVRPNTSMGDGSPTDPMTTLSEPRTFTTTDAVGSTVLTVPPQFTTVIVTTLPGGTFTTFTEVIANPPGVLNPDGNRDSVGAFFQNKGAVAGVFIAASLAICAIVLFVIFALRRRRYRVRTERDAEIAAGLAAAASNQRFADDEDHPVVMRNVPSAMRGRSPWLDDDDDDRLVYGSSSGPIMYSNPNGVGPPVQNMPITSDLTYPAAIARYTPARTHSNSPSPNGDPSGLPPNTFVEPASPTGLSGWSSHGGGAAGAFYAGRRSDSVSPAPTTSAPASAYHGTGTHATSAGHAPSSYGHRPTLSAGKHGGSGSGTGTGSGSNGMSVPSLTTAGAGAGGAAQQRARSSSPTLEDMYPPEYEQFSSRPNSSAQIAPVMGYAYEPDPVSHNHQIVTDLHSVQGQNPYDGMRSPLSADIAMSVASRSMYSSREGGSMQWDDEADILPREDSRLDPVMRIRDGLASAASVGPRDHEDYMRRVVPQPLTSPSTVSHSQGHSQSTH